MQSVAARRAVHGGGTGLHRLPHAPRRARSRPPDIRRATGCRDHRPAEPLSRAHRSRDGAVAATPSLATPQPAYPAAGLPAPQGYLAAARQIRNRRTRLPAAYRAAAATRRTPLPRRCPQQPPRPAPPTPEPASPDDVGRARWAPSTEHRSATRRGRDGPRPVMASPRCRRSSPDGDEARRWAEQELADPVYAEAEPTMFDRIARAIGDFIGGLFSAERRRRGARHSR